MIIFRAYIVSPLLTVHITALIPPPPLIAGCRTLLLCPSLSNMKVSCWPSSSIVAVSVMDEDSRMFQCCDGPTCRFSFFCPYMYILCVCPPGYILVFWSSSGVVWRDKKKNYWPPYWRLWHNYFARLEFFTPFHLFPFSSFWQRTPGVETCGITHTHKQTRTLFFLVGF